MVKRRKQDSPIVYSSELGRMCPSCGKPVSECDSRMPKPPEPGDGIVRVRRETKGRRGKTATTISGIPLDDKELGELASKLKRRCGTGGSVKNGVIEIQGDHVETLIAEMENKGYKVKRAGG